MNITVEQQAARVPVTILRLQGDLDGSNYLDLIAKAKESYQTGAKNLLLDLSSVPYMSSAGLVALHSSVQLLRGEQPPDPNAGWSALKAVALDKPTGGSAQQLVKLLSPQPRVARTLEMSGMNAFFEIYTDEATAVASF
jgi:anti-anti-sigma regulatory factor